MHYPAYLPREQKNKRNMIKVIGEGSVSVQPDQAEITLGAATEGKSLTEAQENNANFILKIKEGLKEIGIDDEQIRTIDYTNYPQYDYIEGKQIFRGYKVEHLLLVNVEQIEHVGLVVDTAVKNGANIVTGIKFGTSNYTEFYQQALALAVVNAGQKAIAIANTLRVQLAKAPMSVVENFQPQEGPIPYQSNAFVKSEAATPIQPGAMDIRSTVTVAYEYVFS